MFVTDLCHINSYLERIKEEHSGISGFYMYFMYMYMYFMFLPDICHVNSYLERIKEEYSGISVFYMYLTDHCHVLLYSWKTGFN